ncbi:MAG: hypothetical protein ACR2NO_11895 [Chloroflexota bacterium]
MTTELLRHLSKAQLLASLRRETAAPFHIIIWNNTPVRLAEALLRLDRDPEDAEYYASRQRVYSSNGAAPARG